MRYNGYMTQISRDDVLHLAQLSSLQLDDQEVADMQTDIDLILGYVEQLQELDTSDIEPTYQVTGLQNVWREDKVTSSLVERQDLLDLAPANEGQQVKVPKVL